MTTDKERKTSIDPIEKRVKVHMKPETAFRRFTTDIASWWPVGSRPLGVSGPGAVVFEEKEGGRILHRKKDGDAEVWGTVEEWQPPGGVRFSFHPERSPEEAQSVEVSFEASGEETLVKLVHSGWESLGSGGAELRERFDTGWEPVLGSFAEED